MALCRQTKNFRVHERTCFREFSALNINETKPKDSIQQPTSSIYYSKMWKDLQFPNVNVDQIKTKVKNLKKPYIAAINWSQQTGEGVSTETVYGKNIRLQSFLSSQS